MHSNQVPITNNQPRYQRPRKRPRKLPRKPPRKRPRKRPRQPPRQPPRKPPWVMRLRPASRMAELRSPRLPLRLAQRM